MNENLAPIAVFAYKRPEHLKKALDSLSKCALSKQSTVYIFCDGPKSNKDQDAIQQTRAIAKSQDWSKELHIVEQPANLGLSRSISAGVTMLCEKYGKVIVVEDDLEVSPSFLEYMNKALALYDKDERVMEISGYMYPVETSGQDDAFFMMHASCWGWGTWQRAWKHFGSDPAQLERLEKDRKYRYNFDIDGTYPYFKMLQKQASGEIDSWGVLWYLTIFKLQGLVLMPRKTLVKNIGQDGSGTNVSKLMFNDKLEDFKVTNFPSVAPDVSAYKVFRNYIFKNYVPWYRKLFRLETYFLKS